jgi:signal transduction histidine kinase
MKNIRSFIAHTETGITVAGLILVVLLGVLDYITGPQISFSVFYLLPISLVTWLTNRQSGIISAVISAATWLMADLTAPTFYSHPAIPYWNAFVRLLVFLAIVYLESALKNLNQDLEHRVKTRTALLVEEVEERKKVEGQLQQYAKRLELLHEIDKAVLNAQSLEAIAQFSIPQVKNLFRCDDVSFILFDFSSHQAVMFEASKDDEGTNPQKKNIPIDIFPDISSIVESLQEQDAWVSNELLDVDMGSSALRSMLFQNYRSLVIVPILVRGELTGSLNLMAYTPNAFSAKHLEIGHEIANQLGIAVKQARMVTQLRSDQENLQSLSQRLIEIQELERRSIARELHDEIGQALTGIGITLEMSTQLPADVLHRRLKQAQNLVIELMDRVSQLSLDLRPALLDDLGLLPALLWHLDRYSSQTNIQAILQHSGLDEKRFTPEVETAAYRIVQEALTNVARHAQVNQVKVTIWFDQNILGIQVEDLGRGFDIESKQSAGNSGGLLGIQERVLLLGGKLTIESVVGSGTRLLAEVPMEIRN